MSEPLRREPAPSVIHQPLTPAAAYGADIGLAPRLGSDDDRWLEIVSLLHLGQIDSAADLADRLVGEDRIAAHARLEWRGHQNRIASLVVLAETIQEAGGHQLGARLLDDLLRHSRKLPSIWKGRVLALRARLEWKLGRMEEAAERYDHIYSMGVRGKEPELKARAELGRATLAQLQGNLPALRTHCVAALDFAEECGATGVARFARLGLAVFASNRGDHESALVACWAVVKLSEGYPILEAETLQNLGQIMLVAGHADVASSAFTAILGKGTGIPDRILLSAIGGIALASARLRREPTVEWSVREAWRASELVTTPRWEVANALLESAAALQLLGRPAEAERYRSRAQALAAAGDFHQLSHTAEQLAREIASVKQAPLEHSDSQAIARQLHELGDRLPRQVAFASGKT